MTGWAEGYVSDIPYALGFYRETVPAHLAFTALSVGRDPGLSLRPRRVLELGIGMGLSILVTAAANPHTIFEGVDFNPLHVAHARGLAEAAELSNLELREASFQDVAAAATDGQHDVDIIVLHGILTWVSADAQAAIVEIARKRLRPGGALYVSYNCMPGWASVLPLQRLMREHAKRGPGRSDAQTRAGIELVKALMAEGAGYFAQTPSLTAKVEELGKMDANYVAHEYLNANWFIFHFADVAEMFSQAKLGYVASATLGENIDTVAVPPSVRARVAEQADPVFKETLRDIAANKQFRRDVYARGTGVLTGAEQNAVLRAQHIALAVPRSSATIKLPTPIGTVEGLSAIYTPILDRLATGPASLGDLEAIPELRSRGLRAVLEAVAMLVYTNQVFALPAAAADGKAVDQTAAHRLNRVLAGKMRQGRVYGFLAAPVAGSGVQVPSGRLMMLDALFVGHGESGAVASYVDSHLAGAGLSWMKDGQPVTDPALRRQAIEAEVATFFEQDLPLWRQLGVVPA